MSILWTKKVERLCEYTVKINMRKPHLDNIRWMTIVLVVIYHVIYMFNGIVVDGVIGHLEKHTVREFVRVPVLRWCVLGIRKEKK